MRNRLLDQDSKDLNGSTDNIWFCQLQLLTHALCQIGSLLKKQQKIKASHTPSGNNLKIFWYHPPRDYYNSK